MPINVPSYATAYYTFGPAVVKMTPADHASGSALSGALTDIGAVAGVEVAVGTQTLQISQGAPRILTRQYIVEQTLSLAFVGLQIDPWRMRYAIGAGGTTMSYKDAADKTKGHFRRGFYSGGATFPDEIAIRVDHESPEGWTMALKIWKAQTTGETAIAFGDDEARIPYRFTALDSPYDWSGAANPSNGRLFRIDQWCCALTTDATAGLPTAGYEA